MQPLKYVNVAALPSEFSDAAQQSPFSAKATPATLPVIVELVSSFLGNGWLIGTKSSIDKEHRQRIRRNDRFRGDPPHDGACFTRSGYRKEFQTCD
jgi:hypothetical protein